MSPESIMRAALIYANDEDAMGFSEAYQAAEAALYLGSLLLINESLKKALND